CARVTTANTRQMPLESQRSLFPMVFMDNPPSPDSSRGYYIAGRVATACLVLATAGWSAAPAETPWPAYGGGPAETRYSALKQINRRNVGRLRVAWTYDTADGAGDPQTQPIMIGGILYGLTPKHKVVALNAANGKLLWRFDSGIEGR